MGNFGKKFGKYAVKNISAVLLICYFTGFLMLKIQPLNSVLFYLTLDPDAVFHGQIWRIVTWIFMPFSTGLFSTIINMFFVFSIGLTLEQVWGNKICNLYILSGMGFTVLGSFLYYGFCFLIGADAYEIQYLMTSESIFYNAVYIYLSAILIFAFCFPDNRVLFYFIFPIKMKWFGIILLIYMGYVFINGSVATKVAIAAALLNFLLFFFLYRAKKLGSPKVRMKQAARRREFNSEVNRETKATSVSKHKCAICGRTEMDNPDLEFRFCSKCNGNYEYCSDHLFSHKHVE